MMRDKYGPRTGGGGGGGGVPTTKLSFTKNKLKIVVVVSFMLLLLIWNTAPFGSSAFASGWAAARARTSIVVFSEGPIQSPQNGTDNPSQNQDLNQKDEYLEDTEAIPEPQTLKQQEEGDHQHDPNPTDIHQTLKQSSGLDEEGNRLSSSNILRAQLFDEIRAQSLPYTTKQTSDSRDRTCEGRFIYLYTLPAEFNEDLAARCDSLFPDFNLCDFFADSGTGTPVGNTRENGSQIFVPPDRWFNTHQYALELVSHARVKKYECLTENWEQASLFYIPFYGGLDVIRWNFALETTNEKRDALGEKLMEWLAKQKAWRRRGGRDHVLVLGKISWDFRRQAEGGQWGSRLLELPETQQMTRVLIERNPWAENDIGVPHPTFFHPQSAADIDAWLRHIQAQRRTHLVTFVGKERPGTTNVRGELVKQCRNASTRTTSTTTATSTIPSSSSSSSTTSTSTSTSSTSTSTSTSTSPGSTSCRFVECVHDQCQVPAFVTKAFLTSHFCMQPVGDSPTRRSVFDSLVAGCIPVLFHPCTAYLQYPWHLPANESSWSVYISEDEVKRGEANVVEVLERISVADREAMRTTIVGTIVPGLLYSAPGSDVFPYRDAFDITIDQLLHRVSKIDRGGGA